MIHEFQKVPGYLEITVDHSINLKVKYQHVSYMGSTRVQKSKRVKRSQKSQRVAKVAATNFASLSKDIIFRLTALPCIPKIICYS